MKCMLFLAVIFMVFGLIWIWLFGWIPFYEYTRLSFGVLTDYMGFYSLDTGVLDMCDGWGTCM
jgi:hypothetical protein